MSKGPTVRGAGDDDIEFYTDETTGLNSYTFADRVKERLRDMGLSDVRKPVLTDDHKGIFHSLEPGQEFNGQLPTVVRKLSLDQLSALYSLFANWNSYLSSMTNIIAVERSEAKKQKEFLWSHVRRHYKVDKSDKKVSDQAASDLARGDYRFIKADSTYDELNALYNCMTAALTVTEADMKMISREVTIQQTKIERDNQGGGFRNRGSGRTWGGSNETNDREEPQENRPARIIRPKIKRRG